MMKRLLFLSHNVPFPPDRGFAIRTYHFLRTLSSEFDIEAILIRRAGDATALSMRERVRHLSEFAEVRVLPARYDLGPANRLAVHCASIARGLPYIQVGLSGRDMRKAVRSALARKPDVVHMDSVVLAGAGRDGIDPPLAVSHHNVESALMRRRARQVGGAVGRYMHYQSRLLLRAERRLTAQASLNLVASSKDRRRFQRLGCSGPFEVIPNAVDTERLAPSRGPETGLVFVGGFDWFPNRDAFDHFVGDILPHLRALGGNAVPEPIRWIGKAEGVDRERLRKEHGVDILGYVDDVIAPIRAAACYVVPLRVGGGTRLKILEAWALGKAVVSTSVGCEGLHAVDGENILVRDDPARFAEAVHHVLSNSSLRDRLGSNGRQTVDREYSWDAVGQRLLRSYRGLI